ncbi:MAG TPA: hypothetical protein VLQ93_21280, partial [Myxococcaceae bacterium]|nr:hypothetical protein [Myxococcaceae bacterium]
MNPPDSPPGAPPPAPPARGGPPRLVLVGLGLVVLAAVGAGAFLLGRRSAGPDSASGGASVQPGGETSGAGASTSVVQALPPVEDEPRQLEVPYQAAPPAFWVDVHAPARAYQALAGNAWLKEQLDKPLGQGFVGGWSAFLGSSGEDLGGSFKGAVLDVVAGKLLASPFRMVWFSGQERSGTPALIVPEPCGAAEAAFTSMSGVARRETAVAESCPGGEGEVPAGGFQLERWLVAEQALWAGRVEDRMVFARSPLAVLQGLCAPTVERDAPEGVDVELGFDAEALGRETQLLAHVLGLAPGTRLQFAIEGQRLVGRGIAGELTDLVGLDSAPLSEELLKLVPEETPVLLALQLKLPEMLERGTLKAFLSGRYKGATRTRQVALLWTPRGDASLPTELALVWGQPEDLPALRELFPYGFM